MSARAMPLRSLAAFLVAPTSDPADGGRVSGVFVAAFAVWAISLVWGLGLLVLAELQLVPAPRPSAGRIETLAPIAAFAVAALLAPLAEEIGWRGWLVGGARFRAVCVAIGAWFGVNVAFGESWLFLDGGGRIAEKVAIAVAVGFAAFLAFRKTAPRPSPAFYVLLVWVSSLLFAAAHASRYANIDLPHAALFLVPQMLAGLVYAFVRTRFGLAFAMVCHALVNLPSAAAFLL